MRNVTDYYIKGSENAISLTLTEEGVAIDDTPTSIEIYIEDQLSITRSPTGNGVSFLAGVLEITPAELTEDDSVLVDGRLYRVKIVLRTVLQTNPIVYGGNDSNTQLHWLVSSNPT